MSFRILREGDPGWSLIRKRKRFNFQEIGIEKSRTYSVDEYFTERAFRVSLCQHAQKYGKTFRCVKDRKTKSLTVQRFT